MKRYSKLRSYKFTEEMNNQLLELKKYHVIESKFVRQAIEEKLKRDLPKLKIKEEKCICPF